MTEEKLTHIDEKGDVRMVDVSQKADTERVAVAEGFISMKPETLDAYYVGHGGERRCSGVRTRGGCNGGEEDERAYSDVPPAYDYEGEGELRTRFGW